MYQSSEDHRQSMFAYVFQLHDARFDHELYRFRKIPVPDYAEFGETKYDHC